MLLLLPKLSQPLHTAITDMDLMDTVMEHMVMALMDMAMELQK